MKLEQDSETQVNYWLSVSHTLRALHRHTKFSYSLSYCLFTDDYKIQSSCLSTLDGHSQLSSGHIHLDVSQASQISLSKKVSTIYGMISR